MLIRRPGTKCKRKEEGKKKHGVKKSTPHCILHCVPIKLPEHCWLHVLSKRKIKRGSYFTEIAIQRTACTVKRWNETRGKKLATGSSIIHLLLVYINSMWNWKWRCVYTFACMLGYAYLHYLHTYINTHMHMHIHIHKPRAHMGTLQCLAPWCDYWASLGAVAGMWRDKVINLWQGEIDNQTDRSRETECAVHLL